MGPAEQKRLREACAAIATNDPALQRKRRETPADSAASIEKELSGFLNDVLIDRGRLVEKGQASLQPLLLLYDLALLQVCDLSYFALKSADHSRRIVWPGEVLKRRPRANFAFYVLSSNLAQSMQAFRLLLLSGFESQSRAMFRSVVETVDLLLVVLDDVTVFKDYVTSFQTEEEFYRHWKKRLSPKVMRDALTRMEANDPITLPINETSDEIRESAYAWLSRFVHVDYVAHVVGAHPTGSDGTVAALAMLGDVGEMSKATLANSLIYLWLSLLRLERLLWKKHGWNTFRGQRSRSWTAYRFRALDEAYRSYLPMFWEDTPPVFAE